MSCRLSTFRTLNAHLASACSTVVLCRTSIRQVPLTPEEREELEWRISRQKQELEGMLAYLDLKGQRESGKQTASFQPAARSNLP